MDDLPFIDAGFTGPAFVPQSHPDFPLIEQIADRAAILDYERNTIRASSATHHLLNISACHANGTPLLLAEILDATDIAFLHDVLGIDKYICRSTGKLTQHFRPRFAQKEGAQSHFTQKKAAA